MPVVLDPDAAAVYKAFQEAGVPVATKHDPGQFHGFFTMEKLLREANVAVSEIGAWLKGLG
jgi:acetyl esterase